MARKLRYLFLLSLISLSGTLFAQSGPGEVVGQVIDEKKEPVINATVQVISGGQVSGGGVTDYDGKYDIKPLNPGTYDVRITYVGYDTSITTGVIVSPDRTTEVNLTLRKATTAIREVVITSFKVPLIDKYTNSTTITSKELEKLPTRDNRDAAATTVGVYQSQRGGGLSLGGARSTGTLYIIDGVQVQGGQGVNLSQGAVDQIEVLTSGVSAKYGDATGGIINITTKGAASEFSGSVLGQHSIDGYNNNLGSFSLSGPLYRKKMADGSKKSIIGFSVGADGYYDHNRSPAYDKTLVTNDDVARRLQANPLTIISDASGPIYKYSSEYVTRDQLHTVLVPPNKTTKELRANGRLDFQLADNLTLTAGGNYTYLETQNYSRFAILFAPSSISTSYQNTTRGWLRFTQKFGKNNGAASTKTGAISNAYYTVQADFQSLNNSYEDPKFKKNIFEYGYVGKFTPTYDNVYFPGTDSVSGRQGVVLLDDHRARSVEFQRSELNPLLANYTSEYYNTSTTLPTTIAAIQNKNALANGDVPRYVYGIYQNVGQGITGYANYNSNQYSLSVDASFDLQVGKNKHSLQFGLYYQQRTERQFEADANISNGGGTQSLWNLIRYPSGLVNKHISLDKQNPIFRINGKDYTLAQVNAGAVIPGPADTILYAEVANPALQSTFDKNLRKKLGLNPNGNDFINVDGLDPKLLSLDMFSADELLNGGNSFVQYYGYTYTGKAQTGNVSFNDFFTQKDANGNYTRPIAAIAPNYTAGYIQDKFQFRDMSFNIGVRIERYDANTNVLKDPYSLYGEKTVGQSGLAHPSNIGDNFIPYVDNNTSKSKTVVGYRNGDDWYDANGNYIQDPRLLKAGGRDAQPYLIDSNTKITDAGFNPNQSFKNYVPQISILPRISFFFPISDVAKFYAFYDIYSQRPTSNNANFPTTAATYYFLSQKASTIIDNPDLKPEKTFAYEVGFQQKLTEQSAVTISAFYKERKDMISIRPYLQAYPTTYYTFGNRDFSTTKGMSVKYDLRRINHIRMNVAYTLQFAEGTGSTPFSGNGVSGASQISPNGLLQNFIQAGLPNIRYVNSLDIDSRHNLNVSLDYRYDEGEGPIVGGMHILQNAGLNILFKARSGEPYTRYLHPEEVDRTIIGGVNGSRLPWHYNVDLRIDKDFKLTFGKKNPSAEQNIRVKRPLMLNVFIYTQNLFNTRDILKVYGYSNLANDNGYLTSSYGIQAAKNQTNAQSYIDLYSYYRNTPGNYNYPRTINLGFQFNF